DGRPHRREVRDVRLQRAATLTQRRGGLPGALQVQVDRRHPAALFAQPQRHRPADPARGARDERHPAVESPHIRSSFTPAPLPRRGGGEGSLAVRRSIATPYSYSAALALTNPSATSSTTASGDRSRGSK